MCVFKCDWTLSSHINEEKNNEEKSNNDSVCRLYIPFCAEISFSSYFWKIKENKRKEWMNEVYLKDSK